MRIVSVLVVFAVVTWTPLQAQNCDWVAQPGSVVETCGKVGIGTTIPGQELDVLGNANISGTLIARELVLFPGSATAKARMIAAVNGGWAGMSSNTTYTSSGWVLDRTDRPGWFARVSTPHDEFAIYRVPAGDNPHVDEARLFSLQSNGWVVLGAGGAYIAAAPLEIAADAGKTILLRDTTVGLGAAASSIEFSGRYDYWGSFTTLGSLKTVKANAVNNERAGRMIASVAAVDGTMTEVAKFTAGTLSVVGDIHATKDIRADGVIYAKYQDVAEWVPANEDLAPGTVVVLNPAAENEVMASSRAYDSAVAGVVSAQPGLILGEGAATKETVATTGRVMVRVDATRHPVAVGDLLVTSDRSGYAMKSLPIDVAGTAIHRPGTILGKALQPLRSGEGEILVLLSLQ